MHLSRQLSIFENSAPIPDPLQEILVQLPKIDLHAHLSGCLRLSTVSEVIQEYGIEVSNGAARDLRNAVTFSAPAPSYAASFQPWTRILNKVMAAPNFVYRAIQEVAEDFSKDGVVYSELRVSPRVPIENGDLEEFLSIVDESIQQARRRYPIDLRVILGFTRHSFYHFSGPDQLAITSRILKASEPYRERTVVGFDLWGNEERHPPKMFRPVFDLIRAAGYPLTIHAGEVYSSTFIRDAIEILGCRRLGHATAMVKDPSLFELIRNRNILTEVCPTSNLVTRVVGDLSLHPIKRMIAEGISVTICTDNTLVYGTSLSQELTKALRFQLITPEYVRQLFLNAATHMFGSDQVRQLLTSRVEQAYSDEAISQIGALVDRVPEDGLPA